MTDSYQMDNDSCNLTCGCAQSLENMENAIRIGNILSIYVLPCIVLPGIFLNVVSCLVFTSSDLKKLSSSVYIFALLVSDTGVLLGLFFVWLEAIGFKVNHVDGVCQSLVFFTYVFSFLSVWYVVCVTVENYITICHPCRIKSMCTRPRATRTALCLLMASVLLYSATPFAAEVTYYGEDHVGFCSQKPELREFLQVFTYLDSLLTLLVPLIAISIMLIGLVLSIIHATRWKRRMGSSPLVLRAPTPPPRYKKSAAAAAAAAAAANNGTATAAAQAATNDTAPSAPLTNSTVSDGAANGALGVSASSGASLYTCRYKHHNWGKSHKRKVETSHSDNSVHHSSSSLSKRTTVRHKTAQVRVTRMLFALSLTFVVMNAPSHVTRLYYLIRSMQMFGSDDENGGCQLTYTEGLVNLMLQYLTYVHNASKFWIFILFSKNFMKNLKRMTTESHSCRGKWSNHLN